MAPPTRVSHHPRRRWLRILLIVVAVLIVLPAAGLAILLSQFNPDAYKPQIIAAVKSATGRTLSLGGPIRLGIALRPTLELSEVALSNPPGFSRPQMMTLQKLEVRLALLPLLDHRIVIANLVLDHPDIRLETNGAGATNWQFTPPAPPVAAGQNGAPASAPPPGTAPSPKPGGMALSIAVRSLSMKGGTLALADDRTGKTTTLVIKDLQASEEDANASLALDASAVFNGLPFTLHGDIGPLARLQDPQSRTPWPVALRLAAGNGTLDVQGSLTDPIAGRGYALRVTADLPSLDVVRSVDPALALPKLSKLHLSTTIADKGAALPDISALVMGVGAGDLGQFVPGLTLDHLDIHAAASDKPIVVSAAASRGGVPVTVDATLGTLAQLLPGAAPSSFPVTATVQAGSKADAATLSVKGSIADAPKLAGVDLAIQGHIADLGALGPLAGESLPGLKDVTLAARLADQGHGLAKGVRLSALSLTMPQADLSGSVGLALAGRPDLTGKLSAKRIDADALRAAMGSAPAPGNAGAPGNPVASGGKPAIPATPAPPARPATAQSGGLIPNTPLPWALLRADDADIALSIATLHLNGQDTHDIALHLVLKNGKLRLDPFAAVLPQGKLSGSLSADVDQAAPPVALKLTAPGLALAGLLKMAGMAGYASGNLEVRADLHGAGLTPHAIAASLDGRLGLAMQGGSIDKVALGNLLGGVLSQINALSQGRLGGGGNVSQIQCFALRGNFNHGIGQISPLLLSSSLLTMSGSGSVALGPETLDMHLRPQGKVAGTALVFPVRVTGPLTAPHTTLDAVGAAEANAGTVAGAALGVATGLGPLAGLLGADKVFAGVDPCPTALAAARFGAAPAAGAAQPAAHPAAAPAKPASNPAKAVGNFLKKLF